METEKNVKVSLIVPIYNGAGYMKPCLESLFAQTYAMIEFLFVDDGSTDDSRAVLLEYQRRDPDRITVLSQKNRGTGAARNLGIAQAGGTYLMFSDSDDYMEPDYVERMVRVMEREQADVAVCGCKKVDESGTLIYEHRLSQDSWSKFRIVTPWSRIVRRDFVEEHDIRFGTFRLGEDSLFAVTAYNYAKKVVVTDFIGYHWIERKASVSNTTQKSGEDSPMPLMLGLMEHNRMLVSITKAELEYFSVKFLVWHLVYMSRSVSLRDLMGCYQNYLRFLKTNYPDYRRNPLLGLFRPVSEPITVRLSVFCCAKLPRAFGTLFLALNGKLKWGHAA